MPRKGYPEEIIDAALDLSEKWFSSYEISKELYNVFWVEVNPRTIRKWLQWAVKKVQKKIQKLKDELQDIEQVNKSVWDWEDKYRIEWDYIFIVYKEDEDKKLLKIPLSLIKDIWYDYSRYWGNLSWEAIRRKYWLTPKAWHLIKSRLWLYKDSNAVPEFLLDIKEKTEWPESVEMEIEEVAERAVYDKYKRPIERKYKSIEDREYRRAISTLYNLENFLGFVQSYLENWDPPVPDVPELPVVWEDKKVYVAFSDLHIGKKESDKVLERLKWLQEDILMRPEQDVKLFFLWDIAEILIEWGRHPWQVESMDWPFGYELFIHAMEVLREFLIQLRQAGKRVSFVGVSWNHWTLSYEKWGDIKFTWELLIYKMLELALKDIDIQVEYLIGRWHSYPEDDVHFILNHWYQRDTKKRAQDILWEFWDQDKHNIILQWDKHHLDMKDVSDKATRIIVPALAWSNVYDESLWISAYTWYVTIKINRRWLPDVTVSRLD